MGERVRSIEIEENLTFQRHQMLFERIGWAVLALLLAGALVGLFGSSGPLSEATVGGVGDPIRLHYRHLDRKSNPTSVAVELAPDTAVSGEVRVWLDRDWVDSLVIESVAPEPKSVEVGPDRLVFVFAARPGEGAIEIVFHLEYEEWWWQNGEIGLDGGPSHEFGQIIYP